MLKIELVKLYVYVKFAKCSVHGSLSVLSKVLLNINNDFYYDD